MIMSICLMCLSFSSSATGLNGKNYLAMCGSGEQFDACMIAYGAMIDGFNYGMIAYPTLVLKQQGESVSDTFYCREKSSKVSNKDEYHDFIQVLKRVDSAFLEQDLPLIYVKYLQHKYPLKDCPA